MSTKTPLNFIIIFSSVFPCGTSVCTKAFGISNVITSLFCLASITPVIKIDSVAAVRLDTSSLGMYDLYVLSFAHALAFTLPSLFSVKRLNSPYLVYAQFALMIRF